MPDVLKFSCEKCEYDSCCKCGSCMRCGWPNHANPIPECLEIRLEAVQILHGEAKKKPGYLGPLERVVRLSRGEEVPENPMPTEDEVREALGGANELVRARRAGEDVLRG